MNPSRREILGTFAAAGTAMLVEPGELLARLAADVPCVSGGPAGELLGTLPLFRNRLVPGQFGVKYDGAGLDARLDTDLSLLEPNNLITPNDLAYIRTEIPSAALNHQGPWTLDTSGLLATPAVLKLDDFTSLSKRMGPHLFECSGNGSNRSFGLMSVAEWEGIPLAEVVARLKPSKEASAVLVSGYDHIGQNSPRSIVGASWVFPLADLDKLGAFLAIRMNGAPVPADHGKPVRLAVPGWYGCSWIKWVNEIRVVGPDELATSQMVEFAARTHQSEPHKYARDYAPADIQTAATPVRVEKRKGPDGLEYRIVGIVWGGTKPVDRLQIRFGNDQPFTPFSVCPAPKTHTMWSLWEYRWKPVKPGVYDIALEVADQSVPQRRLKSLYYMRQVKIEEL